MEKLLIEDFISVKRADIDLKRINIFIGPQAKGKSIISKLISFFKEFPIGLYDAVINDDTKRQFDADVKSKFESIFPKYTWEKSPFLIIYKCDQYVVRIEHHKNSLKYKWCIKYSEGVSGLLASSRKLFKRIISEASEGEPSFKVRQAALRAVRTNVAKFFYGEGDEYRIEDVFYIPAGRSFFANLQKNVFSFISSNIPIDYFLKEFGAMYERTREKAFLEFSMSKRPKGVEKIFNDLICGSYLSEKGQDWIVGVNGRVNLSNSSSGQQEVLPMAMVLSTWPYATTSMFTRCFIVEEPEAHLFPIAQGQIVSLIASAYNSRNVLSSYTITTHSPYILTAFNNLIQAGNVLAKVRSEEIGEKLFSIIPREQIVNFSDVTAYLVDGGTVRQILDSELQLIDASAIDNVSEYFAQKFEGLLDVEMEVEQFKGNLQ